MNLEKRFKTHALFKLSSNVNIVLFYNLYWSGILKVYIDCHEIGHVTCRSTLQVTVVTFRPIQVTWPSLNQSSNIAQGT